MAFDLSVFNFLFGFARKFQSLDKLGIFLAEYLPYILILFTLFLFFRQKNWKRRIYFLSFIILSLILSRGLITETIRFFYHQPRPFIVLNIEPLINHDTTSSFPSGHASAYFALALAIFYLNKKLGWWFLISSLLMGIARIFVGIHWPTDILGGIVIALLSVLLVKKILPKPFMGV